MKCSTLLFTIILVLAAIYLSNSTNIRKSKTTQCTGTNCAGPGDLCFVNENCGQGQCRGMNCHCSVFKCKMWNVYINSI